MVNRHEGGFDEKAWEREQQIQESREKRIRGFDNFANDQGVKDLVRSHEELTIQIRKIAKARSGSEDISKNARFIQMDRDRKSMHRELERIVSFTDGVNEADIVTLFMLEQDNLKEYGLDAALVKPTYDNELDRDEVGIVFSNWVNHGGESGDPGKTVYSDFYQEAEEAIERLVSDHPELVRRWTMDNGGIHAGAGSIGVALDKPKLAKVVKIIRRNKDKYWYK